MAQILQKISLIVFYINTKSKPCERLASSGTGMVQASLAIVRTIGQTAKVSRNHPPTVFAALVRISLLEMRARLALQSTGHSVALVVIVMGPCYKPPGQILHVTVIAPQHHPWTALVIGRTVTVCPPTAVDLPSGASATVTLSVCATPATVFTQTPTGIWNHFADLPFSGRRNAAAKLPKQIGRRRCALHLFRGRYIVLPLVGVCAGKWRPCVWGQIAYVVDPEGLAIFSRIAGQRIV